MSSLAPSAYTATDNKPCRTHNAAVMMLLSSVAQKVMGDSCIEGSPLCIICPRVCCPALQTEFTSLHQWEREYIIFEQLHNKPHFMHFRMWKQFALWRRAVRIRKTNEARCRAASHCMHAHSCQLSVSNISSATNPTVVKQSLLPA